MRVKTFTAPSMAQAMHLVRKELGEDALILASESGRTGVRLVAALESEDEDAQWPERGDVDAGEAGYRAAAWQPMERRPAPWVDASRPPAPAATAAGLGAAPAAGASAQAAGDGVGEALAWHGVPPALTLRLQRAAAASGKGEPAAALASAFERALSFQPVGDLLGARPLMLVGPSGVGKTLTAAKLIVDAHRRGRTVVAASCDTRRAGGVEQLRAFTRILDIPLGRVEAPDALVGLAAAAADAVVVIDTAGTCPFARDEMDELARLIEAAEAEPVLVLAAGCDAAEAAETAAAFARLGCRRMIATRLDVSRRLGAVLAAAAGGRLALAGAGITREAADPPAAVEPLSLARLLLANAGRAVAPSATPSSTASAMPPFSPPAPSPDPIARSSSAPTSAPTSASRSRKASR